MLGGEALEQHQHRQRQRVGGLRVPRRVVGRTRGVGDDRLGQPLADVALAAGASRLQLVDRQPRRDGGDESARRGDLLTARRATGAPAAVPPARRPRPPRRCRASGTRSRTTSAAARRAARPGRGVPSVRWPSVGVASVRWPSVTFAPVRWRTARETLPPARVSGLPAELAPGLGVRRTPQLGHHRHSDLPGQQPSHETRHVHGLLRPQRTRQLGQPLGDLRRLVVDDVVDPAPTVVDGRDGRLGRIGDVDERPDPAAVADHRELALPDRVGLLAVGSRATCRAHRNRRSAARSPRSTSAARTASSTCLMAATVWRISLAAPAPNESSSVFTGPPTRSYAAKKLCATNRCTPTA